MNTFETSRFVLYREVVLSSEVKNGISIIEKGPQSVSFLERLSSLQRLKCTSIIEKGPQSLSFIEKLSSLRRLKCTSIIEKGPQSVSFILWVYLVGLY